ncbi:MULTISPECIES: hypothetical protein [Nocardia]|uniref:hypothetical protein n=1 Tax=Nocardia TaxID=1817 RepID=UPI0024568A95|nr:MULTISPECIES: hypothetical protein [Nocardia]
MVIRWTVGIDSAPAQCQLRAAFVGRGDRVGVAFLDLCHAQCRFLPVFGAAGLA